MGRADKLMKSDGSNKFETLPVSDSPNQKNSFHAFKSDSGLWDKADQKKKKAF